MGGPNAGLKREVLHSDLAEFVNPWLAKKPENPSCTLKTVPSGVFVELVYPYMRLSNTFSTSKYAAETPAVLTLATREYLQGRNVTVEEEPSREPTHGMYVVDL